MAFLFVSLLIYTYRTPLHCAASCNNVGMVKFLVERGACIFATTLSDHETAAEKCEEDEDGFGPCSEYLYSKLINFLLVLSPCVEVLVISLQVLVVLSSNGKLLTSALIKQLLSCMKYILSIEYMQISNSLVILNLEMHMIVCMYFCI